MKRGSISIIILWVVFLHVSTLQAQNQKFGKISKEEFEMETYDRDTSAAAVVLFDIGKTYFNYNSSEGGFQIIFERHKRIKIFNKRAYYFANVKIPLFDPGSVDERLTSLKGYTYIFSDGKVQKFKLENNGTFDEKYSEDWKYTSFTMPKVTEGCIIEYSYTVQSDYITFLREWRFQSSIPVIYSEYTVEIPEFYIYQKVSQGYQTINLKEESKKNANIEYLYTTTPQRGIMNRTEGFLTSENINYTINSETWTLAHAPALIEEEYITVMDDYVNKINYQLAGTKYPRQSYRDVLSSWEEISKRLLENENFGSRIGKGNFLDDVVKNIKGVTKEPREQINLAHEFVKENMYWNGNNELFISKSIRKIYESKRGNSADINLLLTSLLQKLGITAHPVALSTRDFGKINISMPMIQGFNYVACAVKLEGKYILLDATEKYLEVGMLPKRCLNWQGRIISETNSEWINLAPSAAEEVTINSFLKLNESGILSGGVSFANKGYKAIEVKSLIDRDGNESLINNLKDELESSLTINEYDVRNSDDKNRVNIKINVESSEVDIGNLVYINPLPVKVFKENPFKQEKRNYPVDFAVPIKKTIRSTIQLPEDFIIEELPKQVLFTLPDNAGTFSFNAKNKNNMLQVVCSYNLNKTVFLIDEYQFLKKFYDSVISKLSENIVVRKN